MRECRAREDKMKSKRRLAEVSPTHSAKIAEGWALQSILRRSRVGHAPAVDHDLR